MVSKESIESKWLGYPAATGSAIQAKEQELGLELPPSYKEFLKISNGFQFVSTFLDNLLPVEQIQWAKNTEENWWLDMMEEYPGDISDEEYLTYGTDDSIKFRGEYFRHSLKVAEWYDGMCVFLNPLIKHGEEWEVLEYATWYPGTLRYRSFKEYLNKVHRVNQNLLNSDNGS